MQDLKQIMWPQIQLIAELIEKEGLVKKKNDFLIIEMDETSTLNFNQRKGTKKLFRCCWTMAPRLMM